MGFLKGRMGKGGAEEGRKGFSHFFCPKSNGD